MNVAKSLWASVQGDPKLMQSVHGWLTVLWIVAAPPIIIFLRDSVPFLVFISVYAVVTGHWSSWQAARVEVKQDVAETVADERSGEKMVPAPDNLGGADGVTVTHPPPPEPARPLPPSPQRHSREH